MKSNILLDPDCNRILQMELRAIFYKALSLGRNNHFIDFIIRFYSLLPRFYFDSPTFTL